MTGPQHYQEAEKLLAMADGLIRGEEGEASLLAEAQVHATLATAAGAALNGLNNPEDLTGEWARVIAGRRDES